MPYLDNDSLKRLAFANQGMNLRISDKASIFNAEKMSFGHNVRIDDFVCLSGEIHFGNNIHIANFCVINASDKRIIFEDFSGLAYGCIVMASSDDYSGNSLTNPMNDIEFKEIHSGDVTIGRHVIVGTNSVIGPGVTLSEGSAIGALTFVNQSTESWSIYGGIPAKRIKERTNKVLELEEAQELLRRNKHSRGDSIQH